MLNFGDLSDIISLPQIPPTPDDADGIFTGKPARTPPLRFMHRLGILLTVGQSMVQLMKCSVPTWFPDRGTRLLNVEDSEQVYIGVN